MTSQSRKFSFRPKRLPLHSLAGLSHLVLVSTLLHTASYFVSFYESKPFLGSLSTSTPSFYPVIVRGLPLAKHVSDFSIEQAAANQLFWMAVVCFIKVICRLAPLTVSKPKVSAISFVIIAVAIAMVLVLRQRAICRKIAELKSSPVHPVFENQLPRPLSDWFNEPRYNCWTGKLKMVTVKGDAIESFQNIKSMVAIVVDGECTSLNLRCLERMPNVKYLSLQTLYMPDGVDWTSPSAYQDQAYRLPESASIKHLGLAQMMVDASTLANLSGLETLQFREVEFIGDPVEALQTLKNLRFIRFMLLDDDLDSALIRDQLACKLEGVKIYDTLESAESPGSPFRNDPRRYFPASGIGEIYDPT